MQHPVKSSRRPALLWTIALGNSNQNGAIPRQRQSPPIVTTFGSLSCESAVTFASLAQTLFFEACGFEQQVVRDFAFRSLAAATWTKSGTSTTFASAHFTVSELVKQQQDLQHCAALLQAHEHLAQGNASFDDLAILGRTGNPM